jgi:hypothetical protein
MSFNKDYSVPAEGLKNWFLEDEVIKISTELAALQVHVRFVDPEHLHQGQNLQLLMVSVINRMSANIRQILEIREKNAKENRDVTIFEEHLIEAKYAEHRSLMAGLPDWDDLSNIHKTCDDKEFFLELTNHISSRVSGTQKKLNKLKNLKKNYSLKKLIHWKQILR